MKRWKEAMERAHQEGKMGTDTKGNYFIRERSPSISELEKCIRELKEEVGEWHKAADRQQNEKYRLLKALEEIWVTGDYRIAGKALREQ